MRKLTITIQTYDLTVFTVQIVSFTKLTDDVLIVPPIKGVPLIVVTISNLRCQFNAFYRPKHYHFF